MYVSFELSIFQHHPVPLSACMKACNDVLPLTMIKAFFFSVHHRTAAVMIAAHCYDCCRAHLSLSLSLPTTKLFSYLIQKEKNGERREKNEKRRFSVLRLYSVANSSVELRVEGATKYAAVPV